MSDIRDQKEKLMIYTLLKYKFVCKTISEKRDHEIEGKFGRIYERI